MPKAKIVRKRAAKKAQVLGPLQLKWVRALESGRYKQIDGVLFDGTAYCCLGVACKIAGKKLKELRNGEYEVDGETTVPPASVVEKMQFLTETGGGPDFTLTDLNDECKLTFVQIAAIVRGRPDKIFKKSV